MAIVLLFCGGIGSVFAIVPFSRSVLTCSRASNTCKLLVLRGPDLLREERTFELSAVKRALIDDHVDNDGDRLSGVALEVQGTTMVVDGWSNVNGKDKTAWTNDVNRFLQDISQNDYEIRYGSTWPSYILCSFILLIIVAWLRARTQLVIDAEHRVFRIEERIFGTSVKEFPLEEIMQATIEQKVDEENTTLEAVGLRYTDGTIKAITGFSNVEHGDKEQLVAKINDALEKVRGD